MKVIVTGGSGFLGKRITDTLRDRNHKVTPMALPGEEVDNDEYIFGDVTDPSTLDLPECDAVLHCAGLLESSHPGQEMLYSVNYRGTVNIYHAGKKAGMKRFIFISSISAIGPHGEKNRPMDDYTIPRPDDHYGRSKLKAERFLQKMSDNDHVKLIILRPPVMYGEGMNTNSSGMKTFKAVMEGEMPVIGTGEISYNMLYVGNMAEAVRFSLEAESSVIGDRPYIVNEGPYTQKQVVEAISQRIGKERGYRKISKLSLWIAMQYYRLISFFKSKPPKLSKVKYEALTSYVWNIDHTRIVDELGFQPSFTLEEGVDRTCDHYGW